MCVRVRCGCYSFCFITKTLIIIFRMIDVFCGLHLIYIRVLQLVFYQKGCLGERYLIAEAWLKVFLTQRVNRY